MKKAVKIIDTIIGISVIAVGITMIVFAWLLFYYDDETYIIQLASLYVALFISVLVTTMGFVLIPFKKKENKQ